MNVAPTATPAINGVHSTTIRDQSRILAIMSTIVDTWDAIINTLRPVMAAPDAITIARGIYLYNMMAVAVQLNASLQSESLIHFNKTLSLTQ